MRRLNNPEGGTPWARMQERLAPLWKRVRSPAAPFLVVAVLIAPLSGVLATRSDEARTTAVQPARTVAAATETAAAETAVETAAADPGRYARRYGISVRLAREIESAARAYKIDPKVAFGLVRTESSFRRTVVSYAGAVGYTQLLPSTARWIAPGTRRSDLFNTRTNLRVGMKYLRYLLNKYDGNTRLALLAYNRGPGTVDRILRRGGNPANGYARKVLRG